MAPKLARRDGSAKQLSPQASSKAVGQLERLDREFDERESSQAKANVVTDQISYDKCLKLVAEYFGKPRFTKVSLSKLRSEVAKLGLDVPEALYAHEKANLAWALGQHLARVSTGVRRLSRSGSLSRKNSGAGSEGGGEGEGEEEDVEAAAKAAVAALGLGGSAPPAQDDKGYRSFAVDFAPPAPAPAPAPAADGADGDDDAAQAARAALGALGLDSNNAAADAKGYRSFATDYAPPARSPRHNRYGSVAEGNEDDSDAEVPEPVYTDDESDGGGGGAFEPDDDIAAAARKALGALGGSEEPDVKGYRSFAVGSSFNAGGGSFSAGGGDPPEVDDAARAALGALGINEPGENDPKGYRSFAVG